MGTTPSKEHTASYPEGLDTINIIRLILMPTRPRLVKINSVDKAMNLISYGKTQISRQSSLRSYAIQYCTEQVITKTKCTYTNTWVALKISSFSSNPAPSFRASSCYISSYVLAPIKKKIYYVCHVLGLREYHYVIFTKKTSLKLEK